MRQEHHISESNKNLMRAELLGVSINTSSRTSINNGFYLNPLYPFMSWLSYNWLTTNYPKRMDGIPESSYLYRLYAPRF